MRPPAVIISVDGSSEWITPAPAVIHCTSPGPRRPALPAESWCCMPPARRYVTVWKPRLVGVELAANAVIGFTCVAAAAALAVVLWRRRRERATGATRPSAPYVALAVFLLASGLTHLFDVWVIWRPLYWIDSLLRI